jgi:hypothetical protein
MRLPGPARGDIRHCRKECAACVHAYALAGMLTRSPETWLILRGEFSRVASRVRSRNRFPCRSRPGRRRSGTQAAGGVKSLVVVPGNRFQGGKSEISGAIPRSAPVDEPFLIEKKKPELQEHARVSHGVTTDCLTWG